MDYDYLVVGAGFFGSVFAHEAAKRGKRVKVIDKKEHLGGHVYTEKVEGINVHVFGAHIFHTDNKEIWDYINQFTEFNRYTNSPIANYKGEIYNLPFNMNTFNKLWGVITPEEAKERIEQQRIEAGIGIPTNLEEQAISLVGTDIYEKLIKGYTEKQWGRKATDLPAFIIKRLPVRFTYDNNYFNDRYQGIPIGGYTQIFDKILDHELIDVELNADFFKDKDHYLEKYPRIIYTGMIDEYFDFSLGSLEYRSLHFETKVLDMENYQGNAVVNYTDSETPYTRIIEHKHFEFGQQDKTVVTWEYPAEWDKDDDPYYPVNDTLNNNLFQEYTKLASKVENVVFGGRLGNYKYYDMHQVIGAALDLVQEEFKEK